MKLLPYITFFVKDAAKAVKRISQQEFKEVADETLTKLLGIATMVVKMYAIRREGEHEVLHLLVCSSRGDCLVYTLRLAFNESSPRRASVHPTFGCVGQKDLFAFPVSAFQMRTLWSYFY
jgi:hypothetical protein